MVEYAALVSLIVVVSLAAIQFLTDSSGQYLEDSGSDIGTPREKVEDYDDDLPDPPDWASD